MSATIYSERHIGVLIGRFQPFHLGHMLQISEALDQGLNNFKIFIGSANSGRTLQNPFTVAERVQMISLAVSDMLIVKGCKTVKSEAYSQNITDQQAYPIWTITGEKSAREQVKIEIYPLNDYLYNDDKWKLEFLTALFTERSSFKFRPIHTLLGYHKDATSWYLDEFRELEQAIVKTPYKAVIGGTETMISATDIRERYFLDETISMTDSYKENGWDTILPYKVAFWLELFKVQQPRDWQYVRDEYKFMVNYKQLWAESPYPPIFVTTDALVQQGNNILMIQRRTQPGKNMWAMPGGFLKDNELLETGMLRELREETGLRVSMPVLKRCIVNREVIDNPNRSSRGRTITHVFHIRLEDISNGLPAIRGASDAVKARWIPLYEVAKMKAEIFEDHWDIIAKLIKF